jgi:hypothetical protein
VDDEVIVKPRVTELHRELNDNEVLINEAMKIVQEDNLKYDKKRKFNASRILPTENHFVDDEAMDVQDDYEYESIFWDDDLEINDDLPGNISDEDDVDNTDSFDFTAVNANVNVIRCIEISSGVKNFPEDSYRSLSNNEDCLENEITKLEFVSRLMGIQSQHGMSASCMKDILVLLQQSLPNVHWPIRKLSNGNFVVDLDDYIAGTTNSHTIPVDICPGGCISYTLERANLIECPVCHTMRFTPCRAKSHKYDSLNIGPDDSTEGSAVVCDPFLGVHKYGRYSKRKMFYRSIIAVIRSMIEWEYEKDTFIYNFAQTRHTGNNNEPEIIEDILDSIQAKFNLNAMHSRYRKAKLGKPNLVEVSLVLGEFYDGGRLFGRKAKSIWPLVLTILNCNPSDRMKYGIGMFVAAIHDLTVGCAAEQSLFDDYLIPELQKLREGIFFTVKNSAGEDVEIFLQCRLIVHTLDTIALQKTAGIHGIYPYQYIITDIIFTTFIFQVRTLSWVACFVTLCSVLVVNTKECI